MINKELFVKIINLAEKFDKEIDRWQDFGLDIIETPIYELSWNIFCCCIDSYFDEEGRDWVDWYLFERINVTTKEILPCYDKNNNKLYVNNPEDLWELVKDHQLNFEKSN